MSTLRRIQSSRANGAKSRGPSTPAGKQRSSQNAIRHGLLAQSVVLDNESQETFQSLLGQYFDRFQPIDGVEVGMIEEMVSAFWRQRRAWAIETRMLDKQIADPPDTQPAPPLPQTPERDLNQRNLELDRLADAYSSLNGSPAMALMHRYETRLHMMFQRALHNFLILRAAGVRNKPNPISGHSGLIIDAPQPSTGPEPPELS